MSNTFQLFRYQLLPVDRYLQGDLLTGVSSIEELLEKKNEIFSQALTNIKKLPDQKKETTIATQHKDGEFFIFKIGVKKIKHRETREFKKESLDHWPSFMMAIWNHPDKQLIAVQKNKDAFSTGQAAVNMLLNKLAHPLENQHLRVIPEPIFEEAEFWTTLRSHRGNIRSLEFEIITSNMASISQSLPIDLKNFFKKSNSIKNSLTIESDPQAALHIEENDPTIRGLVNYSSNGGGNIKVRIGGLSKKLQTKDTTKEVILNDSDIEGSPEGVAEALKVLME